MTATRAWCDEDLAALAACGRGESEDLRVLMRFHGVPLVLTTDDAAIALVTEDEVLNAVGREVGSADSAAQARRRRLVSRDLARACTAGERVLAIAIVLAPRPSRRVRRRAVSERSSSTCVPQSSRISQAAVARSGRPVSPRRRSVAAPTRRAGHRTLPRAAGAYVLQSFGQPPALGDGMSAVLGIVFFGVALKRAVVEARAASSSCRCSGSPPSALAACQAGPLARSATATVRSPLLGADTASACREAVRRLPSARAWTVGRCL
jgi:uncharacterized NTF2-like protein DUF6841